MDIDSPPSELDSSDHGHTHLELPEFSLSFPLPFRVLFLIGLAILLWAVNLHILHLLGLDTSWILDFRDPDLPSPAAGEGLEAGAEAYELDDSSLEIGERNRIAQPSSAKLYGPVYRLFALYTAWCGGGWVVFTWISGGVEAGMEEWRGLVGVIMVGAMVGGVLPWRGVGERERRGLRKRILFPSMSSPVFFADVILADILTSFAKVLGDLWVSASQIWFGGITHGRVRQYGWSNWITLSMVCLPYALRLRQCLLEAHQSHYTSIRPLLNAFKYFSAFPVIVLSAMQKTLIDEIQQDPSVPRTGSRWHGEHQLFRIWLLAVGVNSIFSFYWDVEMDWGLRLCELDTWFPPRKSEAALGTATPPSRSRRPGGWINSLKQVLKRDGSANGRGSGAHDRSPHPTPLIHSRPHITDSTSIPSLSLSPILAPITTFGLRSTLTFDPLVYHLFTLVDLVLRFTWSLKLSSHLHTISEIESGVFMMEALELVRRWMWVFVRVEWEAVKMGESRARAGGARDGLGLGNVRTMRGVVDDEVVWDEKERR